MRCDWGLSFADGYWDFLAYQASMNLSVCPSGRGLWQSRATRMTCCAQTDYLVSASAKTSCEPSTNLGWIHSARMLLYKPSTYLLVSWTCASVSTFDSDLCFWLTFYEWPSWVRVSLKWQEEFRTRVSPLCCHCWPHGGASFSSAPSCVFLILYRPGRTLSACSASGEACYWQSHQLFRAPF